MTRAIGNWTGPCRMSGKSLAWRGEQVRRRDVSSRPELKPMKIGGLIHAVHECGPLPEASGGAGPNGISFPPNPRPDESWILGLVTVSFSHGLHEGGSEGPRLTMVRKPASKPQLTETWFAKLFRVIVSVSCDALYKRARLYSVDWHFSWSGMSCFTERRWSLR